MLESDCLRRCRLRKRVTQTRHRLVIAAQLHTVHLLWLMLLFFFYQCWTLQHLSRPLLDAQSIWLLIRWFQGCDSPSWRICCAVCLNSVQRASCFHLALSATVSFVSAASSRSCIASNRAAALAAFLSVSLCLLSRMRRLRLPTRQHAVQPLEEQGEQINRHHWQG